MAIEQSFDRQLYIHTYIFLTSPPSKRFKMRAYKCLQLAFSKRQQTLGQIGQAADTHPPFASQPYSLVYWTVPPHPFTSSRYYLPFTTSNFEVKKNTLKKKNLILSKNLKSGFHLNIRRHMQQIREPNIISLFCIVRIKRAKILVI